MNQMHEKMDNTEISRAWHRAALGLAIVAGVFSLIVCVLLLSNHLQIRLSDPLDSRELSELKTLLRQRPDDDSIKEQIRALDLQLRREYLRRREFSRFGSYLLIGGVAAFMLGMRSAVAYRKKLPMPESTSQIQDEESYLAAMARRTVTGFSLVALGIALGLIIADTGVRYQVPSIQHPASDTQQQVSGVEHKEPDADPRVRGDSAQKQEPSSEVRPPALRGGSQSTNSQYPSMDEIMKNWPRFRGPGGLGISHYTNIPASWNGETGEGILWKAAIPLPGKNSPVVWGDRVFVTGADEDNREVYCLDANSGELLWGRAVEDVPFSDPEPPEVSEDTGFAAPTAATDGQRVYAIFANGDLVSFDFDGNRVWARNLGPFDSMYGYSSSLTVYRNLVIVLLDQGDAEDGISEIIAVESASGRTVWETDRPVPNSWATPIIVDTGEREEIITCGSPWVIAYDPATGGELWRAECLGGDIAPSPVYGDGLVFVTNTYEVLAAIRPGGQDNVTETHIVWTAEDGLPDICSPLTNGELVFLMETYGFMTCYDARDGTKVWEADLDETFTASPSLVGDNIYLVTDEGVTIIVKAEREFQEIGRCELGEITEACPAFMDGRIYIRGEGNLYCIASK